MNNHEQVRSRLAAIRRSRYPWWDWGHRGMILLSRDTDDGNEVPRGRDLWWIPTDYVEGIVIPLVANLEQRCGCYITTRYEDVRATAGDIDWRIYDLQDDGRTVKVGQYPNRPEHQGHLQPLPWQELNVNLFLWWYVWQHKGKAQWFGLRRWLYYKALHAAVHQRKPFTCQAVPPKGSGGYDHWHCQLSRRHKGGVHRFRSYTWRDRGNVQYIGDAAG